MRQLVIEGIIKNYEVGLDEITGFIRHMDYETFLLYERTFLKGNYYGRVKELHLRMFLHYLTDEQLLDVLRQQHCQAYR